MSNHGGKRDRAGRRPGSANKRTREAADRIAEDGDILPLDVMIRNMRTLWAQAEALKDKPDQLETRLAFMARATDCAVKAAPYTHSRLSAIEHTGDAMSVPDDVSKVTPREVARRLLFAVATVEHADDMAPGPTDRMH